MISKKQKKTRLLKKTKNKNGRNQVGKTVINTKQIKYEYLSKEVIFHQMDAKHSRKKRYLFHLMICFRFNRYGYVAAWS